MRLRSPVQLSDERGLRGSGVTRDISAGGAFVSTGAACAVGERLSLALMLPGARGRRRVTAVVKWRREPNPFMRMEGDDEGVGVAFVDGGPSLRALACLGKRPARKAHGRRG